MYFEVTEPVSDAFQGGAGATHHKTIKVNLIYGNITKRGKYNNSEKWACTQD